MENTCKNCAYFNVCGDVERTEPCNGKKVKIDTIRYQEIAEKAVSKLMEIDPEEAMEFFRDELDLTEEEREYFEIPTEDEFYDQLNEEEYGESYLAWRIRMHEDDYEESYDEDGYDDDSDRGCKDCPEDECTGHCMSCYYRPV